MKKVIVKFSIPGLTTQVYDKLWADLRAAGHSNPQGLLYHAGAPDGNNFVVVDIWESAEAFARFGEVLTPIMTKNGVQEAIPTVLPLYYEYTASAAAAR